MSTKIIKCNSCGEKLQDIYCEKCKNIMLLCDICGKELSKSTKYGIFCEDMCGFKEAKKTYNKMFKELSDFWL